MDPEQVRALLLRAFPDAQMELVDLTGTRDHYELHLASTAFRAVPLVRQHRLVYAALGSHVGAEIHALALHTYTPEGWGARSAN